MKPSNAPNDNNNLERIQRLLEAGLIKKAKNPPKVHLDRLQKLIDRGHVAFLDYEEAIDETLPPREIARKAYVAAFVFATLTSGRRP